MTTGISYRKTITENKAGYVILLCWLIYVTAYLGRLNYNACLVDILYSLKTTKAQAGLVSSFFYIAYGAGQFINGMLSNKMNPKHMIAASLVLSAIVNLVFPFASSIVLMKYLWFTNGLIQSMIWVNIIRIYSTMLPSSTMSRAVVIIHTSGAAGTIAVYGISSLCLKFFSWQAPFFLAAFLLIVIGFIWITGMGKLEKHTWEAKDENVFEGSETKVNEKSNKTNKNSETVRVISILFMSGFLFALLGAVANGGLRDGITMWAPTLIYEQYNVSASFSVLITLFLPVVSLTGAAVAVFINKKIPNVFFTAAFFFAAAFISLILMKFIKGSMPVTCGLFAVVSASMTAVNTMIVSYLPLKLKSFDCTAIAAGTINSFCYVGSTLASFGFGMIADRFGWGAVIIMMIMTAVCAVAACAAGGIAWNRFFKKNHTAAIF